LIDNGLCLSSEPVYVITPRKISKEFSGKSVSPRLLDKVKVLKDNRVEVKKKLKDLIDEKALRLFFGRVDQILATGMHP